MVRILTSQAIKSFPDADIGRVVQVIMPNHVGRVHCYATSWPAQLYPDDLHVVLHPDDRVIVVGRVGITLLVQPLDAQQEKF
ncbi:MAG: NfeD family protein [Cyanobacteria bacterium P01_E01_bin.6]